MVDRRFIIIGIGLIVVGKVFLLMGIMSEDGYQKCLSAESDTKLPFADKCVDASMSYFVLSVIFLGSGAGMFVQGLRSKAWMKKYT
jgi:hypothetical protein